MLEIILDPTNQGSFRIRDLEQEKIRGGDPGGLRAIPPSTPSEILKR